MLSLIWPLRRNPNAGFMGRVGRIAHWLACGVAALFVYIGATDDPAQYLGTMAAYAATTFIVGRAARYIFAGE
jgi:hypothetical protein